MLGTPSLNRQPPSTCSMTLGVGGGQALMTMTQANEWQWLLKLGSWMLMSSEVLLKACGLAGIHSPG